MAVAQTQTGTLNMVSPAETVARLTWDAVGRRLEAGAIALLPAGAGAKQHGLHLPMMTDQLLAEYFSFALGNYIKAFGDVLIWPTVTYGYYPAFVAYPGSVSLSEAQFEHLIASIAGGLLGYGARQVVIVDAGLSTRGPIEHAISGNAWTGRVTRLGIVEGAHLRQTAERLGRQRHGSHADEIETSIMLALFPELVDMARAVASPVLSDGPQPGPLEPSNPASANFSPAGTFGDPALATGELGERLVAAILTDLAEFSLIFEHRNASIGPHGES